MPETAEMQQVDGFGDCGIEKIEKLCHIAKEKQSVISNTSCAYFQANPETEGERGCKG